MNDQNTNPADQTAGQSHTNNQSSTGDSSQPADQTNDQSSTSTQPATDGNQNTQTTPPQQDTTNGTSALQAELEQTQTKLQEMTQITQRALADLQNFRRRSDEEKTSFVTYANADLINALLPAIDNINRALAHEPKDSEWAKGVEQSLKQLTQALEKRGLTIIPTTDRAFDPRLHEALLTGPGEKDQILAELEKGYMLGEKVIKPARVKVGNGETV